MERPSTFRVSIPEEFIPLLKEWGLGDNLDDNVRVSLAVSLFVGKVVTLARAAELAGKSISDFIDLLKEQKIPWMEYTEEEFRQDEITIKELLKKKGKADE
jgi:predicted HTH domain antitoxin